jgi:hypothetical protein
MTGGEARHRRSRLSHILRRQQRPGVYASIFPDRLNEWRLDDPLPTAIEQADSLILWLGDRQPSVGEEIYAQWDELAAWLGDTLVSNPPSQFPSVKNPGLVWLLNGDDIGSLIESRDASRGLELRLKMRGWQQYETLKRGRADGRTAFMALKFNDPELDFVINECFRPAVARTGFELQVLTDRQGAGLIDDQLRVALRTSRFVIADLTHRSNGAYWEAGFAEGLGKPVIYTCRNDEWAEGGSHFDTNHLVTVIWKPGNLRDAGNRLVNTIRATLPTEAKMTDA